MLIWPQLFGVILCPKWTNKCTNKQNDHIILRLCSG